METACSWLLLSCKSGLICFCRPVSSKVSVWTSCCISSESSWKTSICCSRWVLLLRTSSMWWLIALSSWSLAFLLLPCTEQPNFLKQQSLLTSGHNCLWLVSLCLGTFWEQPSGQSTLTSGHKLCTWAWMRLSWNSCLQCGQGSLRYGQMLVRCSCKCLLCNTAMQLVLVHCTCSYWHDFRCSCRSFNVKIAVHVGALVQYTSKLEISRLQQLSWKTSVGVITALSTGQTGLEGDELSNSPWRQWKQ